VPPLAVLHGCDEASPKALWAHELRWARTVRGLDPAGWLGSAVTHPLAFAVLATLAGGGPPAFGLVIAAIVCRIVLALRTSVAFALPVPALSLVLMRDLLTFAVFVVSFLGRGVTWKNQDFDMQADGRLRDVTTADNAAKRESGR
jgi:ceramide glucosyltransferase